MLKLGNIVYIQPQSTTLTIHLEPKLQNRLDKFTSITHHSKSFLASEDVREFIELNEWQIQEFETATKEAGPYDFTNDQDIKTVFRDSSDKFNQILALNFLLYRTRHLTPI